jgi:hypothetical protein
MLPAACFRERRPRDIFLPAGLAAGFRRWPAADTLTAITGVQLNEMVNWTIPAVKPPASAGRTIALADTKRRGGQQPA